MLRPDGMEGELLLRGAARDLFTDAAGGATPLAEAAIEARVDYAGGRELIALRTEPDAPRAVGLVGTRASSGFRAVLDELLPGERDARSLLYLLLDDVPVATLVSGHATGAAAGAYPRIPGTLRLQHPDLCAGWRTGGTILASIASIGRPPLVTGPEAPPLESDGDPLAWHAADPLPPHGMRRRRRLDLAEDAGALAAHVLFRDSHMDADGRETAIHEYTVRARIARDSLEIDWIEATPQALPWVECDLAAASARRLAGRPLRGLRPHVRAELTGPSTCTHLNDTLRSLEDVVALASLLPAGESERSSAAR